MPPPRLCLLLAALLACGPQTSGDDDAEGTSDATSDATTADAPTTGPAFTLEPDEQLCVDFCLNLTATTSADMCGRADDSCYDWCRLILDYADMDACGAQRRAVLECEATQPFDTFCEASGCAAVYLDDDVCRGWCSHLGGSPGQGSSQDTCDWSGSNCYGHDLAVYCATGDDPECSCHVDDVEVSTCTHAGKLAAFDCGGESVHVFTSCCKDTFLEALQP